MNTNFFYWSNQEQFDYQSKICCWNGFGEFRFMCTFCSLFVVFPCFNNHLKWHTVKTQWYTTKRVYNKNCIGCSPKYPIVNKEECSCILHIFISSRKWTIQSNFNGFQSITRYVNWTFFYKYISRVC